MLFAQTFRYTFAQHIERYFDILIAVQVLRRCCAVSDGFDHRSGIKRGYGRGVMSVGECLQHGSHFAEERLEQPCIGGRRDRRLS